MLSPRLMPVLLLAVLARTAPALDLGVLPRDTQWLVHVDVRSALQGEVGAWLREIVARPDVQPKLAALTVITGFDPLKDLASATLCGNMPGEQAAVVLIEGRFEQERLVTLIKAVTGYAASDVGGHTIHRWIDEKKPNKPYIYGSFARVDLIVLGSAEAIVAQALDCVDGKAPTFDASTLPQLKLPGILVFGQAAGMRQLDLAGANPQAAMLRNVDQASLALSEQAGVLAAELVLVTDSVDSADKICRLAVGLQALAQLNQNADAATLQLVNSLKAAASDHTVRLSASMPVATLRANEAVRRQLDSPAAP